MYLTNKNVTSFRNETGTRHRGLCQYQLFKYLESLDRFGLSYTVSSKPWDDLMRPYLKISSAGYDIAQLAEPLPCMRKTIANSHNCTKKNKYKKVKERRTKNPNGRTWGLNYFSPALWCQVCRRRRRGPVKLLFLDFDPTCHKTCPHLNLLFPLEAKYSQALAWQTNNKMHASHPLNDLKHHQISN